ncbi:hypothetical protein KM043_005041 [Ampulex compressa]|nr:hypothetical protein KM043_005041 [Ampulex compressa]
MAQRKSRDELENVEEMKKWSKGRAGGEIVEKLWRKGGGKGEEAGKKVETWMQKVEAKKDNREFRGAKPAVGLVSIPRPLRDGNQRRSGIQAGCASYPPSQQLGRKGETREESWTLLASAAQRQWDSAEKSARCPSATLVVRGERAREIPARSGTRESFPIYDPFVLDAPFGAVDSTYATEWTSTAPA